MNRQAEFILTIIGAAFSIVTTIFIVIYALFMGMGIAASLEFASGNTTAWFLGIFVVIFGMIILISIASAVFGFIAAFKIKEDVPKVQTYAIMLIVLGGLQVSSIQGILFLVAGILTVTKKTPKVPSTENESEE
ncbi:DUF4064 domain-containing protein [Listeria goaensis]|uniref:DUF4064 domain-containing protein n=1 Tax=Listeria goaensis TaxID=1649188 RepID=UPI000B596299|nr:DUF4064 domain-containing protein [Listeria goaensis]